MAAVKALQQWCKIQCEGYRDVAITNMTTSFRDGLAFCALIHKHRPDLIDFDSLSKENVYENNHLYSGVAETKELRAQLGRLEMLVLRTLRRVWLDLILGVYWGFYSLICLQLSSSLICLWMLSGQSTTSPFVFMCQAFRMAEQELGIPALLDAEDMVALKVPDRLSILTYVSQYYNYFHGRSPIGGMAGIKRPAEESYDEQPGKKNQPVTAKVLGPPKADTENKRDVLVERSNKTGSVSSNCNVCNKHVHLVQRHLVDGKLYHRNCFKCSECSNILLSGTYKPGKEPNTFICKIHTSTQKAPSSQAPQTTLASHSSKAAPAIKITTLAPTDQNSPPAFAKSPSPYKPSPLWQPGKMESSSTPTPAPRSNPLTARSEVFSVTPKSTSDNKKPTDTPKAPSGAVLKNQEARQRFFESAVSPGSTVSVTKSSATSPAVEFTVAKPFSAGGSGAGGGLGKGRVVLRPSDWSKDKEKEKEKENQKEKDKAKSVISKLVVEESNKSSSPSWKNVNTTSNVSPLDTGTKGPSGKTRLIPKVEDLEETPTSSKTPGWLRNKDKDLKPASTPQTSSKGESSSLSLLLFTLVRASAPFRRPAWSLEHQKAPRRLIHPVRPQMQGLGLRAQGQAPHSPRDLPHLLLHLCRRSLRAVSAPGLLAQPFPVHTEPLVSHVVRDKQTSSSCGADAETSSQDKSSPVSKGQVHIEALVSNVVRDKQTSSSCGADAKTSSQDKSSPVFKGQVHTEPLVSHVVRDKQTSSSCGADAKTSSQDKSSPVSKGQVHTEPLVSHVVRDKQTSSSCGADAETSSQDKSSPVSKGLVHTEPLVSHVVRDKQTSSLCGADAKTSSQDKSSPVSKGLVHTEPLVSNVVRDKQTSSSCGADAKTSSQDKSSPVSKGQLDSSSPGAHKDHNFLLSEKDIEFGEHMFNRHGSDVSKHDYIRQKMREVARLLLVAHKSTPLEKMEDFIIPANYMHVISAVKVVAGYNSEKNTYSIPSLALKLGHSLQKICGIVESNAMMCGNQTMAEQAKSFRIIHQARWNEFISAGAITTLKEARWNVPQILPFTEDVKVLNAYLEKKQVEYERQLRIIPTADNYACLAKVTLVLAITFNRRRAGEVSKMDLSAFMSRNKSELHEDVALCLPTFEQKMCQFFSRVEFRGKRGRMVAVLLKPSMVTSLELLIESRENCEVPKENPFMFARPNALSAYRGAECLRQFANECGAQRPHALTSTRLRKHIATMSQILNLEENEADQLADFLGHDIRIHRQYYRLPQGTLQLAKMSKVLMAMERGKLLEFKGKSLDEIEIHPEEVLVQSDVEMSSDDDDDDDDVPADTVQAESVKPPVTTTGPDSTTSFIASVSPKKTDSETGSRTSPADSSSAQKAQKVKPGHIPKEEIMRELREIEMNLNELEKNGVELEKQLRNSEEEGEEDTLMNDLMVDWFNLIRNKQVYIRRESELVYIARTQDLEEEQPTVEAELRKLMEKPDHLKTSQDSKREKELMAKLVEIVNDRNAIVDGLDEDRLREEEEDEQLNKMMQNLDIKKEKKKKSPMSKLFRRMSKREPAES
ncbi:hypothetical protein NFI96_015942 [Prochilodus magdalenae]|nr:hypothetical protein NFI96_015942 [Prochilodus magdalenae]